MNLNEFNGIVKEALGRVPNGTVVEVETGGVRYGIEEIVLMTNLSEQLSPIILIRVG